MSARSGAPAGARPAALLREAAVSAIARPAPTVMIALVVASCCLVTLLTVGRTAAAEAQVAARLESAGARLITISTTGDPGLITPAAVEAVGGLGAVAGAVALGTPRDVVAAGQGAGGTRVPLWSVTGDPAVAVTLVSGRWAGPGEAMVAEAARPALGLDGPVGAVEGAVDELPVVGVYRSRDLFSDLDAGVLAVPGPDTDAPARELHVLAVSAEAASSAEALALEVLAPSAPGDVRVQSPETLADVQAGVGADVGAFGRTLLLLVLGAGGVLSAVVVLADTLVRRADLGRRLALGATRGDVVVLIVLRTALPAVVGALAGSAVAVALVHRWAGGLPVAFTAGVVVLAVMVATLAAVPPAVAAARSDPLRVLRTP